MTDETALSSPLLATKFQPPLLRESLVGRPRLLRKLTPAPGVKLTLVSAPAGAGKSTLLSQWCAAAERPVAWLSLAARDNALHRFLRYFVAALRRIDTGIAAEADDLLWLPQRPAIEPVLIRLLNDVASTPQPFSLILDDYHLITDDHVHDALLFLIHRLPPGLHLIVATRADPPWPLARLRARGELAEIRGDALRFSPEEATSFLNRFVDAELPSASVAALLTQTEGWVAGLQLAGLALQGAGDDGRQQVARRLVDNFAAGHHFVLDYLAEEVLEQQPAAVRTFLLQTSLLERMCGPLCNAITGDLDGTETLALLARRNAFIVPLDTERRWYRYHHLFAALLQRRLPETLGAEIPVLYRRASEWFEAQDLIEEAIEYAVAAGNLDYVAQLVERYGLRFIASGDTSTVGHWLAALPKAIIDERLQLSVFRAATAHWTGDRDRVRHYLDQAERLSTALRKKGVEVPAQILGNLDSIRAHTALVAGEVEEARERAERALTRLQRDDILYCKAADGLGGAYWGLGNRAASERAFREAYDSALAGGHRRYAVIPATYVALQQIKQGRLLEAADTCATAWKLGADARGRPMPVAGFPAIRLGDMQREWNQLERAEATLQQALDLCLRLNHLDILADAHVTLARLRLARAEWEGASESVAAAEQLVADTDVDGFVASWLQGVRLRLWLASGDLEAAMQWAKASSLRPDGDLSYYFDLHHIHLARLLLAQAEAEGVAGYLDTALALLQRLREAAETAGWVHETIQILLLQAQALLCSGDEERAIGVTVKAVKLAEPGRYVRTFVDEGAPMGHLLRAAIATGLQVDYTARLLAAMESDVERRRQPEPAVQAAMLEPLSDRELEVLRFLPTHLTSTEIAEALTISVNTVRTHIKSIYGKLDAHSRGEAVERARSLGIL